MKETFFKYMTELSSRKFVSKFMGALARSGISRRWIRSFAKSYGIPVEDAEKSIEQYISLNDFFTRRLKPGKRKIDDGELTVISPVDAKITGIGKIEEGKLFNIKGQDYDLEELLNHSPRTVNYRNGFYFVLYLSPKDYHRIHVPVSGKIEESEHISGRVYPVNEFGLRHMKKVLSRNERLVTYIRHDLGGEAAVVKVGALNVASIRYVEPLKERVVKGDELAYFEFGSTVVLLLENNTFEAREDLLVNKTVQMGEALGVIKKKDI